MRKSRVMAMTLVVAGAAWGGCRESGGDATQRGAAESKEDMASSEPVGEQASVRGVEIGRISGTGDAMRATAPEPGMGRALGSTTGSRHPYMAVGVEATSGKSGQSSLPVDATAPMIVRSGNATIEVDSIETAVARLRMIAQSLGGYVGNTAMQGGRDQVRSATVELKVPSNRWTDLLTGLAPIGKLEASGENAQDVGEEFVDVTARATNARRLEDRLVSLLANQTGKLQEVLSVERELARVREEIERHEGRMRYLRTRAQISTMLVTVHEPTPVLGNRPGSNPLSDAFRAAWRNFVGLVAGVISSLGILIPLALVAWLLWWLFGRRLTKRIRGEPEQRPGR